MAYQSQTLLVSQEEVEAALPMLDCINCMEEAFRSLATGGVLMPLRSMVQCVLGFLTANRSFFFRLPDPKNLLGLMPTSIRLDSGDSVFGVKVLSIFPGNAALSRHAHQGVVLLFDGQFGQIQAIVDAFSVTKFA